jgi:tyrosyl-tRNA synthetase
MINFDELRNFFPYCEVLKKENSEIKTAYIGFETSAFSLHLGSLFRLLHIIFLKQKGVQVKVLLANELAYLNKKGDRLQMENFRHALTVQLLQLGFLKEEIITSSDLLLQKNYIFELLKFSTLITSQQAIKAFEIMGRKDEKIFLSNYIYALAQLVDVKFLNVDLAIGGTDQRKIHVLAHERFKKEHLMKLPGYLHFPVLPGLFPEANNEKMSKSKKGVIFVNDDPLKITKIINSRFCDPADIKNSSIFKIMNRFYFFNTKLTNMPNFALFNPENIISPQHLKEKFIIRLIETFKIFKN